MSWNDSEDYTPQGMGPGLWIAAGIAALIIVPVMLSLVFGQ